ncbi:hypothetical protein DAEQUDRAFT_730302 [Daedalea quercina L-15889]|uniref:Uncharacterized protein n=1 Tax=Daedalea quercina L-15889 TaxID=1314783 RepID=A0A165N388_9APHY|nr:hypothetical protein DAEQUDRAFT_730302 [Daedalea quercina L-15889]
MLTVPALFKLSICFDNVEADKRLMPIILGGLHPVAYALSQAECESILPRPEF